MSGALGANAARTNRHLLSRMRGSPPVLYEAASHLIAHGGKRLRPFMVVQSCKMLGGTTSSAMRAASAVEMIHNFTLVHDDIMDDDDTRHGVPTVHKKYDIPLAILAGDVLFSKAFETVSGSDMPALARVLSRACVDVCEGQVLDMRMAASKKLPTRQQYIGMIRKKTAALFEVSCAMGAICAGAPAADISRLSLFGRNLGIAFQITDDLIGVMGDPNITKKPVGNDLRQGKKSLPILAAIGRARGAYRRAILGCFGNTRAGRRDLDAAVGAIRDMGIEDEMRGHAMRYASRARRYLGPSERRARDERARDELVGLLDLVVKRTA